LWISAWKSKLSLWITLFPNFIQKTYPPFPQAIIINITFFSFSKNKKKKKEYIENVLRGGWWKTRNQFF